MDTNKSLACHAVQHGQIAVVKELGFSEVTVEISVKF
jgi:hypothetical protein